MVGYCIFFYTERRGIPCLCWRNT